MSIVDITFRCDMCNCDGIDNLSGGSGSNSQEVLYVKSCGYFYS
jgi:hypothetical protein